MTKLSNKRARRFSPEKVKDGILSGRIVESSNGWFIGISDNDEVEMYPPKGDGFKTTLASIDRIVGDFCKKALPVPTEFPKPKDKVKIPPNPLGPDTSGKHPKTPSDFGKPKDDVNVPDGVLGPDSTTRDKKLKAPSINQSVVPPGKGTKPNLGPDSGSQESKMDKGIKKGRIVDSFIHEPTEREIYAQFHAQRPSEELLRGIADEDKWAATQALRVINAQDDMGYEDEEVAGVEELIESWINGNRKWVISEIMESSDKDYLMRAVYSELDSQDQDIFDKLMEGSREASDRKQAGPKLREKWKDDGSYDRDLEAESPEDLYALTQAFGGEEVDWGSIGRPKNPREMESQDEMPGAELAPPPACDTEGCDDREASRQAKDEEEPGIFTIEHILDAAETDDSDKQAVDEDAKKYYEDYFGDYGKQLVSDEPKKKAPDAPDVKDTKDDKKNKKKDDKKDDKKKEGQGVPIAREPVEPAPSPEAVPPVEAPAGAPPPTGKPPGPLPEDKLGPGVGQDGLIALGWTQEDVKGMTDEQKKGILQLKLKKPVPQPPLTPGAPAPGGPPGPGAPPAPLSGPAPVEEEKIQPVVGKKSQMGEEIPPGTPPTQPLITPSSAVPEAVSPITSPVPAEPSLMAEPGVLSPEEEAFKILQEVQQQQFTSESPKQLVYAKSQELTRRLQTDIGMSIPDAEKLFNVKGRGFTSLFAKKGVNP